MSEGPLERYRAKVADGALSPDPMQAQAAEALQTLHRALKSYVPGQRTGWFGMGRVRPIPRGLYLHGDVGRGKSMLMDMFFDTAPLSHKRRVHFNAFMAETHERLHEWRRLSARERMKRAEYIREAGDDPIAPVAKRIANEASLLCFDEFQVTDVADAMILGRLFEQFFAQGVVVVLTSNTPPEQLYENGINRQLFLPFITLIKARMSVFGLNGPRDYRLDRMAGLDLYLTPLGPEAEAAMDAAWNRLTNEDAGAPMTLAVQGRELIVPKAAHGVARMSFEQLCARPLGAGDYLVLAHSFHTVLIDHIPQMSPAMRNEARRFTLLIDTLYDEGVKLVCSAAVPPGELYREGDNAKAFDRTVSRLIEMQSDDYLKRALRSAA